MSDGTGKAGTGKRALTEDGRWVSIKSLSPEIQAEIKANSKHADEVRRHRALGQDRDVQGRKSNVRARELSEENTELKALVREQSELLEKIRKGMDEAKAEEKYVPVKMTKKQKLQAKAEELGLEYEDEDTIGSLESKIKEAASF